MSLSDTSLPTWKCWTLKCAWVRSRPAKSGTQSVGPHVQLCFLKRGQENAYMLAKQLTFSQLCSSNCWIILIRLNFFSSLSAGTWYGKFQLKELKSGKCIATEKKKGKLLLMSKISNRWFYQLGLLNIQFKELKTFPQHSIFGQHLPNSRLICWKNLNDGLKHPFVFCFNSLPGCAGQADTLVFSLSWAMYLLWDYKAFTY